MIPKDDYSDVSMFAYRAYGVLLARIKCCNYDTESEYTLEFDKVLIFSVWQHDKMLLEGPYALIDKFLRSMGF